MNIHPQAIVSPHATLGHGVTVGPFSIIEPDVVVGDNCTLASRVVLKNGTSLGSNNTIYEGSVLGGCPQHTRPPERLGRLTIGSNNTIRENCTLHRALHEGTSTRVGNHNLLMVGAHVAHDCQVGDNAIFANNVLLGGFVTVGDRAFVSGAVGVHQFCRIGRLAMIGGCARVVQDVPPYVMVDGTSGMIVGLNLVGLRRNGYSQDQIAELKAAYRLIYRRGLRWVEVIEQLKLEFTSGPAADFHPFLSQGTRGFVQERRMPPNATLKLRRATDEEEDRGLTAKAG
ncbi:MAG: acyl-ACP--UDP-N-acetylglucosamine O-acyltransferase [Planctomycetia bacterium]|nr:acyl-ACP--UDP-N-acetylglucosamine O-acyltransferase [Planctomycetia bacterium]